MCTAFAVDPTLKGVTRFRNGSVREPYERSLYERTFTSEHAISTELSTGNREKHKRDREPSRRPIRSMKNLRNKSRKVREFVHACILIPISSTLCCYRKK